MMKLGTSRGRVLSYMYRWRAVDYCFTFEEHEAWRRTLIIIFVFCMVLCQTVGGRVE